MPNPPSFFFAEFVTVVKCFIVQALGESFRQNKLEFIDCFAVEAVQEPVLLNFTLISHSLASLIFAG